MAIPRLPETTSSFQIIQTERSAAAPVRVLFIEQLSTLIGKSTTTIRTFATNEKYKHLIPRPWKMPHSRRLCWYEHEVLQWIDSQRPTLPEKVRRPRGRPTKQEQLARARFSETAFNANAGAR